MISQLNKLAGLLSAGEETRANHESCPSGVDLKQRLWVHKSEDGLRVTGYCHHCTNKHTVTVAGINANKDKVMADLRRLKGVNKRTGSPLVNLPKKMVYSRGAMPVAAQMALKGIPAGSLPLINGIGYSNKHKRVVISSVDSRTGQRAFIQFKRVLPRDTGPKYYNMGVVNKRDLVTIYQEGAGINCASRLSGTLDNRTLVLTEDVFSAISVSHYVDGIYAMPLYGVSMSGSQLSTLVSLMPNFSVIILALDNDNPTVKAKTTQLYLKMRRLGKVVNLRLSKDLKEHTGPELVTMINNAVKV